MFEPKIVMFTGTKLHTSDDDEFHVAVYNDYVGLVAMFPAGPFWFDKANATALCDALTRALEDGSDRSRN